MEIGKEEKQIVIEPLTEPVPDGKPAPAPVEPKAPEKEKEREKVPA